MSIPGVNTNEEVPGGTTVLKIKSPLTGSLFWVTELVISEKIEPEKYCIWVDEVG